jgi:Thymidylate synthase
MMNVVGVNINEAYYIGLMHFVSRNTPIIEVNVRGKMRWECAVPFSTTYLRPTERVLFDKVRDCNPYFHFFESLWILAGRNDVKWLEQWLPSIREYSDDGIKFHGAYGARLYPQFNAVVNRLQRDPTNTRTVLQIYDWGRDAYYDEKDMPCNTMIFLTIRNGKLNMTVCNRSNDLIWGAYGANVVQFSMLQEYLCARIGNGTTPGIYTQFSHNTHVYPDEEKTKLVMSNQTSMFNPYELSVGGQREVEPSPLVRDITTWRRELGAFMTSGLTRSYREPLFELVAKPMMMSHMYFRERDYDRAYAVAGQVIAKDWRMACMEWIDRRIVKNREKNK